jgi:hypothetical protein
MSARPGPPQPFSLTRGAAHHPSPPPPENAPPSATAASPGSGRPPQPGAGRGTPCAWLAAWLASHEADSPWRRPLLTRQPAEHEDSTDEQRDTRVHGIDMMPSTTAAQQAQDAWCVTTSNDISNCAAGVQSWRTGRRQRQPSLSAGCLGGLARRADRHQPRPQRRQPH